MEVASRGSQSTDRGKIRIRFCSSLSSTSRTRYVKRSGNLGLTEKASLTSRMQALDAEGWAA